MAEETSGGRKIFSVSELTRAVKSLLEKNFPFVWVAGEVSNFKCYPSGHWYFTLKDAGATLSGVMFRNANQAVKFKVSDGLEIIAGGRLSVYEAQGKYQIIAELLEPKGLGALQLAFEQLKEKLAKEGLFDPARKRPLPFLPRRVGIVTSPTGAVIRDIIHVTQRRFPGLPLLLCPVRVQGEGAAAEIAGGIEALNRIPDVDVLIVGRGGGSIEDLWSFNEEIVARAIAASRVPVISAVGHETDFTIADFAADRRAPTPSAAAELISPLKEDLIGRIWEFRGRMRQGAKNTFEEKRTGLDHAAASAAFRRPGDVIRQYSQRVDDLLRQAVNYGTGRLNERRALFQGALRHLEALNPLGVLARGYSILLNEKGHVIRSSKEVKSKMRVKNRLKDGLILSVVEGVETDGK